MFDFQPFTRIYTTANKKTSHDTLNFVKYADGGYPPLGRERRKMVDPLKNFFLIFSVVYFYFFLKKSSCVCIV